MGSTYGADASITGSLAVDGDIDLGSGDDDVDVDAGTLFIDAGNDRVGIGTLTPDYTLDVAGNIGVDQLNQKLQCVLNPTGISLKRGERELRVGDKVLQTRNNYNKMIFNSIEDMFQQMIDNGIAKKR